MIRLRWSKFTLSLRVNRLSKERSNKYNTFKSARYALIFSSRCMRSQAFLSANSTSIGLVKLYCLQNESIRLIKPLLIFIDSSFLGCALIFFSKNISAAFVLGRNCFCSFSMRSNSNSIKKQIHASFFNSQHVGDLFEVSNYILINEKLSCWKCHFAHPLTTSKDVEK